VGADWGTLEAAIRKYEAVHSKGSIFSGNGNKLGSEMNVRHANQAQEYFRQITTVARSVQNSILEGEDIFFWFALAYVIYVSLRALTLSRLTYVLVEYPMEGAITCLISPSHIAFVILSVAKDLSCIYVAEL
jgi:hypothetical protein